MAEASRHDSPEVVAHLLTLLELQERSERIHRKIEEVTARLQHAQHMAESPACAAAPRFPLDDGQSLDQSILSALKDLDGMLAQQDLMTRSELRSRLQDLIHRLGERGSA